MNDFEQNVQSKRNDAIDSGRIYRLIWFFATLFIIATVIKFIEFLKTATSWQSLFSPIYHM